MTQCDQPPHPSTATPGPFVRGPSMTTIPGPPSTIDPTTQTTSNPEASWPTNAFGQIASIRCIHK